MMASTREASLGKRQHAPGPRVGPAGVTGALLS